MFQEDLELKNNNKRWNIIGYILGMIIIFIIHFSNFFEFRNIESYQSERYLTYKFEIDDETKAILNDLNNNESKPLCVIWLEYYIDSEK